MTFEEFERGYLSELLRGGVEGLSVLRREPTKEHFDAAGFLKVTEGLRAFWEAHGAGINTRPSLLQNAPNAFHAGHELWRARNNTRAFSSRDWGVALAGAMNTEARVLGGCTVTATSRTQLVVEREADVRITRG